MWVAGSWLSYFSNDQLEDDIDGGYTRDLVQGILTAKAEGLVSDNAFHILRMALPENARSCLPPLSAIVEERRSLRSFSFILIFLEGESTRKVYNLAPCKPLKNILYFLHSLWTCWGDPSSYEKYLYIFFRKQKITNSDDIEHAFLKHET